MIQNSMPHWGMGYNHSNAVCLSWSTIVARNQNAFI